MWGQTPSRNADGVAVDPDRSRDMQRTGDVDAHAHSPSRVRSQAEGLPCGGRVRSVHDSHDCGTSQCPLGSRKSSWNNSSLGLNAKPGQSERLNDPFLDSNVPKAIAGSRRTKKTSEDTLMLDIPSCESNQRNGSDGIQSGLSLTKESLPSREAVLNHLMTSLSPVKSDDGAPGNPANTPASGGTPVESESSDIQNALIRALEEPRVMDLATAKWKRESAHALGLANNNVVSEVPGQLIQSRKERNDEALTADHRAPGADFTHETNLDNLELQFTQSDKPPHAAAPTGRSALDPVCLSPSHCQCCHRSQPSTPCKEVSRTMSEQTRLQNQSPHTPEIARTANV